MHCQAPSDTERQVKAELVLAPKNDPENHFVQGLTRLISHIFPCLAYLAEHILWGKDSNKTAKLFEPQCQQAAMELFVMRSELVMMYLWVHCIMSSGRRFQLSTCRFDPGKPGDRGEAISYPPVHLGTHHSSSPMAHKQAPHSCHGIPELAIALCSQNNGWFPSSETISRKSVKPALVNARQVLR